MGSPDVFLGSNFATPLGVRLGVRLGSPKRFLVSTCFPEVRFRLPVRFGSPERLLAPGKARRIRFGSPEVVLGSDLPPLSPLRVRPGTLEVVLGSELTPRRDCLGTDSQGSWGPIRPPTAPGYRLCSVSHMHRTSKSKPSSCRPCLRRGRRGPGFH